MKSKHVDKFQHDLDAETYDMDVRDESNPVRTGYRQTLNWVAHVSNGHNPKRILEMGSGTGALTRLLKNYVTIVCVDASAKMMELARGKLGNSNNIQYSSCDFLEYFDLHADHTGKFDMLVSTYALHHLTETEKEIFFQKAHAILEPDGRMVIGDLMFFDPNKKKEIFQQYEAESRKELITEIEEEYFWDISLSKNVLSKLGFSCQEFQFSQLSWGLDCFRPHGPE